MLLERLIEPRLREILERIAGILAGATAAVLHSRDVLLAAGTLARVDLVATARPSPARRLSTLLPPPLLPPVALVAPGRRAVAATIVDSDHGHLTTMAIPTGQHWAGITEIWILIDTQQLVCRIDDVHAQPIVSPRCSPDRASNLPICWLPWLLLPPPLLLLLLPRFSAEPTSLPANSSFMSPPRVTLPGHANSRILLAREPLSMSPRALLPSILRGDKWRRPSFLSPSFLPSFQSGIWMDPSTRRGLWGGVVPGAGSADSRGTARDSWPATRMVFHSYFLSFWLGESCWRIAASDSEV